MFNAIKSLFAALSRLTESINQMAIRFESTNHQLDENIKTNSVPIKKMHETINDKPRRTKAHV